MVIKFSKTFSKQYDKLPLKIREKFDNKLLIFSKNKFHPVLNNHSLTGKSKDCRSINVTGDYRAVFRELENGNVIFFLMIGTHSQLYN